MKRFFGILGLLLAAMVCAAQVKPVVVTPTGRQKLVTDDALDAKVYVDDSGVLLGSTTGTAKHEEISISGLPAQTTPGSGTLLLASEAGVLKKVDVAHLPGGGSLATDALWDAKGDLTAGTGSNTAAKLTVGTNGLFLQAASGESTGLKWAAASITEVFTSSGTWTKPTGATSVRIICIAGGGGGGAGRKGVAGSVRRGGSAGGSGGRSELLVLSADLSSTETVTVGTGGSGGAAQTTNSTNGANGNNGNESSFGAIMRANPGFGGLGGTGSSGSASGGGTGIVSAGQTSVAADASGGAGAMSGTAPSYASTAGGGGGGITTGNAVSAGGNGGTSILCMPGTFSANLGAAGASGSAGGVVGSGHIGQGGGGGGSSKTGNAGDGGDGGGYGAGGGGGGAALDSVGNSGAGGDGSNGVVIVITYF